MRAASPLIADIQLSRRHLVLAAGATALSLPRAATAKAVYGDFWAKPREISLYRAETGEGGRFEYWRDGRIDVRAWYSLLHLLRDVRAGVALHYAPAVVDIVWAVQEWIRLDTGTRREFRLTDGSRIESTNRAIPGASPESEHLKGHAIDGRFEGIPLRQYANGARFFRRGGVGLYSGHVHVDCGALRTWGM